MPAMKFAYVGEDFPSIRGRIFDGPPVKQGILGPFRIAELRWVKVQLGIKDIDELDIVECQAVYFLLAIRREDHTALPFTEFRKIYDQIAGDDFEVQAAPEVAEGDAAADPTEVPDSASEMTTSP